MKQIEDSLQASEATRHSHLLVHNYRNVHEADMELTLMTKQIEDSLQASEATRHSHLLDWIAKDKVFLPILEIRLSGQMK
ncbi:hypothetical protein CDL15_Pgr010601 [Punica granatum]|nr:hypothetical protein CDL15_Pgr010601 [Punica granatum]